MTRRPRIGVAVGDQIIDVSRLARSAGFDADVFERPNLNAFMALGPLAWAEARNVLRTLLDDDTGREVLEPHLIPLQSATMHLPIEVADYVDFYASEQHARNLGAIFRPGADPLTPNWKHLPIGYHGRAGTVVVSGTDVVRPAGQRKARGRGGTDVRAHDEARYRGRARLGGRAWDRTVPSASRTSRRTYSGW